MIKFLERRYFVISAYTILFGIEILFMPSIQAQELPPDQSRKAIITKTLSLTENNLRAIIDDFDSPSSQNAKPVTAPKAVAMPRVLPPFKSLRYDEDYRYLQDRDHRSDFWDPIKYIPIRGQEDWFLSIGGEMRQRYEFYHNPNFGSGPANHHGNNDYSLQRYLVHGDLHLGRHFRIFGQFMSSLENGRIGGPRPEVDRNTFDLHQGFIDFVTPFTDALSVTWRLGRQELEYGSGRLISAREIPNTRRSFDAARALLRVDKWAIDGFWGKPVRNRFGAFDDDSDPNKSLWGVYAVRPNSVLPDGHIDLYYLGFENKHGVFAQGTGHELRHTLGTRLWGLPLPWEYNVELIWQFGRFGAGNINAWAVATNARYNLSDWPFRPRLGLTADITSGDRNPNSANLQTYNPLFPTGAYFNIADLLGPSNFIHVHPSVDLYFSEKLKATLDWGFFWRENVNDAPYSIATFPIRSIQAGRKQFSGSSPSVTLVWDLTRNITMLASYVHFFPGPFFGASTVSKPVDFFTTWLTYKF